MKSAFRSESATHGHHRRNLVPTANGKKRERQTPRNSASPGVAQPRLGKCGRAAQGRSTPAGWLVGGTMGQN